MFVKVLHNSREFALHNGRKLAKVRLGLVVHADEIDDVVPVRDSHPVTSPSSDTASRCRRSTPRLWLIPLSQVLLHVVSKTLDLTPAAPQM
jgi:hypothetical protein